MQLGTWIERRATETAQETATETTVDMRVAMGVATVEDCIRRLRTKADVYNRLADDAKRSGQGAAALEKLHKAEALDELAAEWKLELGERP